MYKDREVFPNAPLEFVAAELRFPFSPKLASDQSFNSLVTSLASYFPVPQREPRGPGLEVSAQGTRQISAEMGYRFMNLVRTESVAITQTALTVETTDYKEFDRFRSLLQTALDALAELDAVVTVERLGLRYIDELRVPTNPTSLKEWKEWVTPSLLEPLTVTGVHHTTGIEGLLNLKTGTQTGVAYRYATLNGIGVVGNGPLKRRSAAAAGPYFVVDIDSYWQGNDGDIPGLPKDWVIETFDRLHDPVGELFLGSISERFKNEVARKAQ